MFADGAVVVFLTAAHERIARAVTEVDTASLVLTFSFADCRVFACLVVLALVTAVQGFGTIAVVGFAEIFANAGVEAWVFVARWRVVNLAGRAKVVLGALATKSSIRQIGTPCVLFTCDLLTRQLITILSNKPGHRHASTLVRSS